jgi:ribosomal protein S27AE
VGNEYDFDMEFFEKYIGEVDDVVRSMEDCPGCGAKFILTHQSDNGHMLVREIAKCIECDYGSRRTYHQLN